MVETKQRQSHCLVQQVELEWLSRGCSGPSWETDTASIVRMAEEILARQCAASRLRGTDNEIRKVS